MSLNSPPRMLHILYYVSFMSILQEYRVDPDSLIKISPNFLTISSD